MHRKQNIRYDSPKPIPSDVKLFLMWSQCFEEAAHTCTGLCKNLCHSISQPVVEKMHFVLYGVGHLDAHPIQRIGFFSLFDGGKEQHTNAQPEVQCVDGLEGANAEILKPKALLFTAEILFNSPTGKVALHHLHHILFAGNGAIGLNYSKPLNRAPKSEVVVDGTNQHSKVGKFSTKRAHYPHGNPDDSFDCQGTRT